MEFNFEENTAVEDINVVPEKYRGLYVEGEDGKHTLAESVQGLVGDYVGTVKTLAGVRQDKKKVTDENAQRRHATKAVEDFAASLGLEVGDGDVVDVLKSFVADLQEQVKGGKQIKVDLDKIKSEFDRRMAEMSAAKDKEIAERDGALSRHLVSNVATAALAKHKGAVDLLLPHVERQCEVVREDNGEYSVRVKDADGSHRMNGSGGWMGVDDLVVEMKGKDAFARAFESDSAPGAGTRPGSMNRPTNTQRPAQELSPTEKIREGLRQKQYRQ